MGLGGILGGAAAAEGVAADRCEKRFLSRTVWLPAARMVATAAAIVPRPLWLHEVLGCRPSSNQGVAGSGAPMTSRGCCHQELLR